MYFIGDDRHEVDARCGIHNSLRRSIILQLQELLHERNSLVRLFKTAIDMMPSDTHKIVIHADKTPAGEHVRRYNAPTIDEVAIVIVGDQFQPRDIVLHRRNNQLINVAETHRCYDALQYPLIFWDGADGYHFNVKMINPVNGAEINKKCSSMNFYAYRLMIRMNEDNHILKFRQLFHQYLVDMYAKIETERLLFLRLNQTKLRSEEYIHLRDAVVNDGNTTNVGKLTILPSSFIGSPRHMQEYAQDAMSYVRHYGRPDLFITFTCNPVWDEIQQLLFPGQSHVDRHDIIARVFRQKLKSLMDFIVKLEVFGSVRCWMYSVEWQKRGLPHAHILIWLYNKITSDEIDDVICAEIPRADSDKDLHAVIIKNMIHGPCGTLNPNSPCMVDGKCSKQYPRAFTANTVTGDDGYPRYRRRSTEDGGNSATIHMRNGDIDVDNRWVVPYSPLLSKTYQAHINVEYCNSVKSIKYICKYVNKGSDMAVFSVQSDKWNVTRKVFVRRKRGEPVNGHPGIFKENTIGRLYTVHPNQDECFYLRMLLVNVPGPTSFQQLKIVDGVTHATFRATCQALNLLENDQQWNICINDACNTAHPNQIRALFAIILTACFPSSPTELWERYRSHMAEDILHRVRLENANMTLEFTEAIYNEALINIEDKCLAIANKVLSQLGMPAPTRTATAAFDVDLRREQSYNINDLQAYVQSNIPKLTWEQKGIYDRIMQMINDGVGGTFFLDAPGGTGKTFLIRLILATVRSKSDIALALASSGIAATLLPGGRTAHSALKLPLNMQIIETPTCNISKASGMGKVLQKCKLIVWDECTMAHKKSLEALDRSLRDLRGNVQPFGNALILLAGDFRQTLPVISRSTPADEINACLKYSTLWRHVHTLELTTNMRVQLQNDPSAEVFSRQLLEIGNGQLPVDETSRQISLPDNFCNLVTSKEELIEKVFPDIQINHRNHDWLSERAILAAKNKDVYQLNNVIQSSIQSDETTYKSIDTVVEADEVVNYPTEFLNSLDLPGIPPHILKLKVGVPIILLRNINQPKLCNGTRLAVKRLMNNVVEATILTGPFKGEDVLIPRIPTIPTDTPFQFKRLQFPIRLAFAITINKAQGQSLELCGLDLDVDCFSHGQLYVACSRVGKPDSLYIYADSGKTKNIVYKQVLQN
ncbi:uncharacterized protein LOC120351029 isoform X2 [Nilaparvata lugens]|nr:uncharacterized protein LOC120351029 isoform X2 [Nilaparvata lugens]